MSKGGRVNRLWILKMELPIRKQKRKTTEKVNGGSERGNVEANFGIGQDEGRQSLTCTIKEEKDETVFVKCNFRTSYSFSLSQHVFNYTDIIYFLMQHTPSAS